MLSPSAAIARDGPAECGVMHVSRHEDWERLFTRVPAPHFTQAWCYGEGKRAERWGVERLVFLEGNTPVALCQVLIRKVAGLPVAARINRGPLFLEPDPSAETQRGVLRALRRRWRFARRGLLFFAPSLPSGESGDALLREAGFRQRKPAGWHSAVIDLQLPLEKIRANVSREWRKNLNAALKSDLVPRISGAPPQLRWMLERHADNMRHKGFQGPGLAFLRRMIESSPGNFHVFQAALDERPCSGLLVAQFGTRAETYLSWTDDVGRRLNAHTLLMWHAFVEMKRLGCRALDLGGYSTREKYGAYKRTMKGQEYQLAGEWLAL